MTPLKIKRRVLIALIFLFLPLSLLADRITLRDGQIINGRIVNQSRTNVVIRTANGVQNVSKDQIARIQYGEFPDAEADRRRKEEERHRQEELRREAERARQAELAEEKEEQREQESRRKEEERRTEEDQEKDPTHSPNKSWFNWIFPDNLPHILWDPALGQHRMKVGLSIGTTNNTWPGEVSVRSFRQSDALFSQGGIFYQENLKMRNGAHSSADLEYGYNRYFLVLQGRVSKQNGEAPTYRTGPQKNIVISNVENVYGNVVSPGTVQTGRLRWEEGQFLFGYRILYTESHDVDFVVGMHRSDTLVDLSYESFASFDLSADRWYSRAEIRNTVEMKGPLIGFRGQHRLFKGMVPEGIKPFVPGLEWDLMYQESKGHLHFSYLTGTASILAGSRGQYGSTSIDMFGTGLRGSAGLVFSLPYRLSLHVGGYGSSRLLKATDFYNQTDDSDLAGKIRSEVFPHILKGAFTSNEVHRGTYFRLQWEHEL